MENQIPPILPVSQTTSSSPRSTQKKESIFKTWFKIFSKPNTSTFTEITASDQCKVSRAYFIMWPAIFLLIMVFLIGNGFISGERESLQPGYQPQTSLEIQKQISDQSMLEMWGDDLYTFTIIQTLFSALFISSILAFVIPAAFLLLTAILNQIIRIFRGHAGYRKNTYLALVIFTPFIYILGIAFLLCPGNPAYLFHPLHASQYLLAALIWTLILFFLIIQVIGLVSINRVKETTAPPPVIPRA